MCAKAYLAVPLTREYARQYLSWRYEPPYDFYNIPPEFWQRELEEMFRAEERNAYFAVLAEGELAGYFELHCRKDAVEIGVALRPDLTGCGEGRFFLACVLQSAQKLFQPEKFTLLVAAFNDRARRLYEAVGFLETGRIARLVRGSSTEFICMEMPAAVFCENP